MGAPHLNFVISGWRAFNAGDVAAATAMHHPVSSIVEVDQVHGRASIARGADGIRRTMAAYMDMKPHIDVVTHQTTVSGDFAMTRSQWLIRGQDKGGKPVEVHYHGMRVHRRLSDGSGSSLSTIPGAPIPNGRCWPRRRPGRPRLRRSF